MRARVVLTIASLGPGRGTGLSANPTRSRPFITNAFIALSCEDNLRGRKPPVSRFTSCVNGTAILIVLACGLEPTKAAHYKYAPEREMLEAAPRRALTWRY